MTMKIVSCLKKLNKNFKKKKRVEIDRISEMR